MMRYIRDLRLIPIALIASACLLVLKLADLAFDSSRWFVSDNTSVSDDGASVIRTSPDAPQPPGQKLSWARQMFNFPDGSGASTGDTVPGPRDLAAAERASAQAPNPDVTGAIATPPAAAPPASPVPGGKDGRPVPPTDGIVIPTDGAALPSGAERAILERLQQRREELDSRARELDIRESLLKAAEQRIDAHLNEVKEVEARIKTETQQKDQAEVARFKGLVTMYENMKPRDAAKIFDGLDMDVLIQVASQINPRTMADIMAQMTPEMAERLTVELASKAQQTAKNDPVQLPKIEGQPTP
jgi:flagellar motility protein MotE (MotC chaperone)